MDCIVIGGGALGLASAAALLQQGASVTVVEQGEIGRESSWAGGGILSPLCPWDYSDEVTRLALAGMREFPNWVATLHAATGIDPEYQRCGMQILPPLDVAKAQRWAEEHGEPLVVAADGSVFLPQVAQVRNPRLLQALRARVAQLGGKLVEHCAVQGLERSQAAIRGVQTARGILRAERYLLTAGAWSHRLMPDLAREIKPVRGQMLLFKFSSPPLPHIVLQQGLYLIPRRDGHLLVGSTLEEAGFDKSTTAAARAELHQHAASLLPALAEMQPIMHWSGLRPGTPGNLPLIGRHPLWHNLFVNAGHFRYGVTMAPASVAILLNEMQGLPQTLDVAPYRP